MKRVFLDTNILIDLLGRPEYVNTARKVLIQGINSDCAFFVSYLSLANYAYISRKIGRDILYENLSLFISVFTVVSNDVKQLRKALEMEGVDFEDILQFQAAKVAKCDLIITRNKKDFSFSDIPVLTPDEFLAI